MQIQENAGEKYAALEWSVVQAFTKYLCFYEVFSNVSKNFCESSPKTPPLMKYLNSGSWSNHFPTQSNKKINKKKLKLMR